MSSPNPTRYTVTMIRPLMHYHVVIRDDVTLHKVHIVVRTTSDMNQLAKILERAGCNDAGAQ